MDYVIAVQAPAFPLADGSFALESAFAEHLRQLRQSIGPRFHRLVLFAPCLPMQDYQKQRDFLTVLSPETDGIAFVPAHTLSDSAFKFLLQQAFRIWRNVWSAMSTAAIVHSGLADDVWRPLMAFVNLAGLLRRRPLIFFVDIDFRRNTERYYRLGLWPLKSYITNRLFFDPVKWLQVWLAVRLCSVCFVKSASMVRDFGRGRENVHFFLDAAHNRESLITPERFAARQKSVANANEPLEAIYFGRLVDYKGLDWTLDAVAQARRAGAQVTLKIVGHGECSAALKHYADALGLQQHVKFLGPVPYGDALFELIDEAHVTIATPRVEDTPRAALDSLARGVPLVAFDIEYFEGLARMSGAVALAEWPDPSAVAARLIELGENRDLLLEMSRSALTFAAENTQEIWLRRRTELTLKAAGLADETISTS